MGEKHVSVITPGLKVQQTLIDIRSLKKGSMYLEHLP